MQTKSRSEDFKISVLLATRNHAEFLPQCLEGIVGQTFREVEFLIFNDVSTDQTASILDTFDFRDIPHRVIHSRERRGAPGGMNFLLTQARGEFVWPIASDDYCCDPTFLAEGMSMLIRHPVAAGFFGMAKIYNQDLGKTEFAWGVGGLSRFITPREFAKGFFANRNGPHGAAIVIRREWLTRTRSYDSALGAHCDYLPNSAAGLRQGFCYVAKPVVVVRVFGDRRSFSANQTPEENITQIGLVELRLRQILNDSPGFPEKNWTFWRTAKICSFLNVAHRVRNFKKINSLEVRKLLYNNIEDCLNLFPDQLYKIPNIIFPRTTDYYVRFPFRNPLKRFISAKLLSIIKRIKKLFISFKYKSF